MGDMSEGWNQLSVVMIFLKEEKVGYIEGV